MVGHLQVDNELIYAYAKTNKLAEMEEFISSPNCKAKFQEVGDQLFDEKLFQAAKILFNHINNFAKLAICLVLTACLPRASFFSCLSMSHALRLVYALRLV